MATATLVQAKIDPVLEKKQGIIFKHLALILLRLSGYFLQKGVETGRIPFIIGLEPDDVYDAKSAEIAYGEYENSSVEKYLMSNLFTTSYR